MAITFVHQGKGVDSKPIPEQYSWTVDPGSGIPAITALAGRKALLGGTSKNSYYPALWDLYDDLAVEHRPHLVAMADSSQAAELSRDIDILDQAATDDLTAWQASAPPPPPGREAAQGFFLVLENRRDVYNKLFAGEGRENDSLEAGVNMAVTAYEANLGRDQEAGSSRIVLDTSESRFTGPDWKEGIAEIGRHEMGHAITAVLSTEWMLVQGLQDTQMWVIEGFADYLAFRGKDDRFQADLRASVRGYPLEGTLPGSFYSTQARARSAHYALGVSALRYMATTYGESKMFTFVAAHYADPKQYEQQIATAAGRSVAQFQDEWAVYARSLAGGR